MPVFEEVGHGGVIRRPQKTFEVFTVCVESSSAGNEYSCLWSAFEAHISGFASASTNDLTEVK